MALPAKTIDEVLAELDRIIDKTVAENNFLGVFAYVYRRTTAQIKQAIAEKQFEDNTRMQMLDVAFANMYLAAYEQYSNNLACSRSWKASFDAGKEKIAIIQHLMMGMNAHINLDLGIAAATMITGSDLSGLKKDFMKVNLILNELVNEMQNRLSKVSRLMFLVDWAAKNSDEAIVGFSMAKAREQAWNLACILADREESGREQIIDVTDSLISGLSAIIKNPPGKLLKMAIKLVSFFEERNVSTIIIKLREDLV